MDNELLKSLGQIAGIGGITLGVSFLWFRDFIAKNIFPKLTKNDAFKLLRLTAIFMWTTGLAGVGCWAYGQYLGAKAPSADISAGRDIKGRDISVDAADTENSKDGGAISAARDIEVRDITVKRN